MTLVLLSILVFSQAAGVVGGFLLYRRAKRKYDNAINNLNSFFFIETGEDKATDFARTINQVAQVFALQIGAATLTAINTSFGGTMKGAAAELKQMGAEGNLALVIEESLPKSIKKSGLAKYGFGKLIGEIIAKVMAGQPAGAGSGSDFRLGNNGQFHL